MKSFYLILIIINVVLSQDLSNYFEDVERGNVDKVKSEISDLLINFPENDGVLFLSALLKDRAEEAVIIYKSIVQNYPNSSYADDSLIKIGEYLYARGLYTQASTELRKIPVKHSKSEHLQRCIDLQINSLLAIGEIDSAKFYINKYSNNFTSLDFNYDFSFETPLISRPLSSNFISKLAEREKTPFLSPSKNNINKTKSNQSPNEIFKPYVVQVGAFGSKQNAIKQSQLINENGFNAEVWPISVNNKDLFAVQIARFATFEEANLIAEKLKDKMKLSFLIINRPLK